MDPSLTGDVRAGCGDEVESETGVGEEAGQAVLQPREAVSVQADSQADEVGQGGPLHAVHVHVRREQEDSQADKDIGE